MNAIHESWKQFMATVDKNFAQDEFDKESMEFGFIAGAAAMFKIVQYIHSGGKKLRTSDEIQRALVKLETEIDECKDVGLIAPIMEENRKRH